MLAVRVINLLFLAASLSTFEVVAHVNVLRGGVVTMQWVTVLVLLILAIHVLVNSVVERLPKLADHGTSLGGLLLGLLLEASLFGAGVDSLSTLIRVCSCFVGSCLHILGSGVCHVVEP